MIRELLLAIAFALALSGQAEAQKIDRIPRTVVMTAFPPEWDALVPSVERAKSYQLNGRQLLAGTMNGKPVLLMQSGVSMVNAAMSTQLVLDRFVVKRIVFSGIAGGVDPSLAIGDVVVPADWAQYLEVSFARHTDAGWVPPEAVDADAPANFGMMFPRGVRVGNAREPLRRHYRFPVDPTLLALARRIAPGVRLHQCVGGDTAQPVSQRCLTGVPKVVVGGTGVSAGVFADNAEFRDYLFSSWKATVLDMESAAVAQVAYANGTPAIVFRSLSDLAGGNAGPNQMKTFMVLSSVNSAEVVHAFIAALPD